MDPRYGDRISSHLYRVAWWDIAGQDVVCCDVFAIDCGETVVLIDSGCGGNSYPIMKGNLIHWGLWGRVSTCLLTHLHMDHAGGVMQLQADGVKVWGGEGAAAYNVTEKAETRLKNISQSLDRVLNDGETFSLGNMRFEMLDTPGHTSTCVSYFIIIDSVRCAFTGDLVMPNGNIGYSGSFYFSVDKLHHSLNRVFTRDFDALLTGHMLRSSQPEGFWMQDGRNHVMNTIQAGIDGNWVIQNKNLIDKESTQ